MNSKLTQSAQSIIKSYEHLSIAGHDITCPYINNRKNTRRGALRVDIGKGSAAEIVEEVEILAARNHVDLQNISDEKLTKFLVDKHLGLDCSAFAFYTLQAEYKEKYNTDIAKKFYFPHAKSLLRKFLTKLRPIENINVTALAHKKNSEKIKLTDIQACDMIIMLNGGPRKDYNHVLIVTDVQASIVNYTHSFTWPSDGAYGHGIKHGTITVTDAQKSLLDQDWQEAGKTDEDNWTYMHAKSAKEVFVARIIKK